MGPISLGNADPDVIGRLVATFGQPDSIEAADEGYGLCPGETGRVIEFGYLTVITRAGDDGEAIVGYRQRMQGFAPDHPSGALRTISGLQLGDSLSGVQRLYSRVVTAELTEPQDETLPAGSQIYVVQRSSDGRTLIWGGLANAEDAEDQFDDPPIRSINSPNSCDRGPAP